MSNARESRTLVLTTLIALVVGITGTTQSSFAEVSAEKPMTYQLDECKTTTELDCVVSVKVLHFDGTSESASIEILKSDVVATPTGALRDGSFLSLKYHSSSNSGPEFTILADAKLTSPEAWKVKSQRGVEIPVLHVGFFGDLAAVDDRDIFTVTVRTSWLVPLDVSMYAKHANVSMKKITGGREWAFSGSKTYQSLFTDQSKYAELQGPNSDKTKSDVDVPSLYWRLGHVSKYKDGSAFDTTCSEFGYTVTSSNASSAGMPSMIDAATLAFNIAAPHFMADGSENIGYFQADLPTAWIDCKFKNNTLTKSPKVEISITDEGGVTQVATTTVSIQDKVLYIRAYGFHYSAPKIIVRGIQRTPNSNPVQGKPKVKALKSFTCKKGALKKSYKAVTIKCPQGWTLN